MKTLLLTLAFIVPAGCASPRYSNAELARGFERYLNSCNDSWLYGQCAYLDPSTNNCLALVTGYCKIVRLAPPFRRYVRGRAFGEFALSTVGQRRFVLTGCAPRCPKPTVYLPNGEWVIALAQVSPGSVRVEEQFGQPYVFASVRFLVDPQLRQYILSGGSARFGTGAFALHRLYIQGPVELNITLADLANTQ